VARPLFANVNDASRAVAIVQRMVELNKRFAAYAVTLVAPEPIASASGRYLLPVNAQGQLTGWAEKALSAQVGNIAGEQAGAGAARGLGSVIRGGGLAGGFLKKKGKETGAAAAMGGKELIRSSSSLSFNPTGDYAVYLHAKLAGTAEYQKALTAAIALYPDLETGYDAAVTDATASAATISSTTTTTVTATVTTATLHAVTPAATPAAPAAPAVPATPAAH